MDDRDKNDIVSNIYVMGCIIIANIYIGFNVETTMINNFIAATWLLFGICIFF